MSTLLWSLAKENPWPGLVLACLNLVVALSLVGLRLLLRVTISLLAGLHAFCAKCRHWSGRAVRWSSCAILLRMKFAPDRPYSDPEKAARKILEIANSVEPVQDGRIHIELISGGPFLSRSAARRPNTGLASTSRSSVAGSGCTRAERS
jgi:hypothetical protein